MLNDRVIVLADAAERADEIDIERAEEARERARLALERRETVEDLRGAGVAAARADPPARRREPPRRTSQQRR